MGYLRRRPLRIDVLARFVAALRGNRSAGFHECRRCGTTVEPSASGCPACESSDIARYDL